MERCDPRSVTGRSAAGAVLLLPQAQYIGLVPPAIFVRINFQTLTPSRRAVSLKRIARGAPHAGVTRAASRHVLGRSWWTHLDAASDNRANEALFHA
jgi:hypothetical protein